LKREITRIQQLLHKTAARRQRSKTSARSHPLPSEAMLSKHAISARPYPYPQQKNRL
jgi:hypothetical protein